MTAPRKPLGLFTRNRDSRQAIALAGWWPGLLVGAPQWHDLSPYHNGAGFAGFANPFTATSGWVAGKDGGRGALAFDAALTTVATATRGPISITNFSVALWAKWTSTGTTVATIQALVDNNHNTGQGFVIQDRPDLSKVLSFFIGGSSSVESTVQVGDGTWKHIVCTYDGTTAKMYINGQLNNSAATSAGTIQTNLTFGKWQGGTRYLTGTLEDPRLYARVLSAADVWHLYDPRTRWSLRYVPGVKTYYLNPGSIGITKRVGERPSLVGTGLLAG